jgi:PAS domain-containing protein
MKRLSRTTSVLGIAILFGLIFWVLDGVVNYFFFPALFRFMLFEKPNDLLEAIVTNIPPHALFVRLFLLTGFIVGGLLVAAVMQTQRRTERDRVRLLLQVQEQARRIQGILDTIPEGVVLLDEERKVMMANPVAERNLPVLAGPRTGIH